MSRRWPFRITLAAALCLPFLTPSAAHAQDEEKRGFSLDLQGVYRFLSSDRDRDEDHQEGFGLRGTYRFNNVWALEAAVLQLDGEGGDDRFLDFSAKAYFLHSNLFEVYALAGTGHSQIDGFIPHLGLGAEIPLGSRAYLRPEILGRWDGVEGHDVEPEVSLGVGWRF